MTPQPSKARKNSQKYNRLLKGLQALIKEGEAGDQLPSYTEMCRQFEVCQSTITDVLFELEQSNLIERRPWKGIYISTRANQKRIGVVFDRDVFVPGFSPVFSQFASEAKKRAKHGNEELRFYIDTVKEHAGMLTHSDVVTDVRSGKLDGIILLHGRSDEEVSFFSRLGIPLAFFSPARSLVNSVQIDFDDLIQQGVNQLKKRGCVTVGFISHLGGMLLASSDPTHYRDVFRAAAKRQHLKVDESWVIEETFVLPADPELPVTTNEERGYNMLRNKLGASNPAKAKIRVPDGLVVTDDMVTRGLLIALERDYGLKVAADIQIATHSNRNSTALFGYESSLELLETDPAQFVDALFQMIESQIAGTEVKHCALIKPRIIGLA